MISPLGFVNPGFLVRYVPHVSPLDLTCLIRILALGLSLRSLVSFANRRQRPFFNYSVRLMYLKRSNLFDQVLFYNVSNVSGTAENGNCHRSPSHVYLNRFTLPGHTKL